MQLTTINPKRTIETVGKPQPIIEICPHCSSPIVLDYDPQAFFFQAPAPRMHDKCVAEIALRRAVVTYHLK